MEEKERQQQNFSQPEPDEEESRGGPAAQADPPKKVLPFAPGTERVEPSVLKIVLMTLGVIAAMLVIGWVRSKIGR